MIQLVTVIVWTIVWYNIIYFFINMNWQRWRWRVYLLDSMWKNKTFSFCRARSAKVLSINSSSCIVSPTFFASSVLIFESPQIQTTLVQLKLKSKINDKFEPCVQEGNCNYYLQDSIIFFSDCLWVVFEVFRVPRFSTISGQKVYWPKVCYAGT